MMPTHASSVPGGFSLSLPPLPMSCFSLGWMVSKPQLPRYPDASSVCCCIIRPGTATPPSSGYMAASWPGIQGPTSRGPYGPAGILPPKAQSWVTSKVGLGSFLSGSTSTLLGVCPTSTRFITGSMYSPISLGVPLLVHSHLQLGAGGDNPSNNGDGGVSRGQPPSPILHLITHHIQAISGRGR